MVRDRVESHQPPVETAPPPYAYYPPEDEINLADLWWVLVRRKYTLFSVAAIVTLVALLYALLATPVYRAEAVFMPPTASDIEVLNISGVQSIDTGSTYTRFKRNLTSVIPRETIFQEMNLRDQFAPEREPDESIDEIFSDYNETFTIITPKVKKDETPVPTITLSMEWEDPVLIAKIVNRIAKEAERVTTLEIIADLEARIGSRIKDLNREIQLLRVITIKQRQDEIERRETADALERRNINDKIASLRSKVRDNRMAEISRLDEADRIERAGIEEKVATLRSSAKEKRLDTIANLEEADNIERKSIEEKISTLRSSAKAKRLDRLAKLKEGAGIAHSLGIKDSIGYKLKKISDSSTSNSQILTNISNNAPQMYTRGYEAIEAEISSLSARTSDDPFISDLRGLQDRLQQLENNEKIDTLKARKNDDPFIKELRGLQDRLKQLEYNEKIIVLKARESDDPFIPELRGLQERLKLLEHNRKVDQLKSRKNDDPFIESLRGKENELARLASIYIDPATVTTARLDQAAYAPEQRIKPRRKLIAVLGLMLGLMLGVFAAFFVNFIENQKEEQANA